MNVISKFELPTANRGMKTFVISVDAKGRMFAHELGQPTQWAKVFGTDDVKAHRCNPTVRYGNQYGRYYRPKPARTIEEAIEYAEKQANICIQFC